MVLTPEKKLEIRQKAVTDFRSGVTRFHDAGATLRETENGSVKPTFMVGAEIFEPIPAFPKANLADAKWVARVLSNQDAFLTKAQVRAEIEAAVADLPLTLPVAAST